jgi:hypothetical protein
MSPAFVDNVRARDPLRSLTRVSVRSYRTAPITSAASACESSRSRSSKSVMPMVSRWMRIAKELTDKTMHLFQGVHHWG